MRSLTLQALFLLILAPLASAQTRTSCAVATKTPAPAGYICNKQGTVRNPGVLFSGTTSNQAGCRDLCVNTQSNCQSFSYGPGKKCNTFYSTIKGAGYKASATSETFFWSTACFNQTCGMCPTGLTACDPYCFNLMKDAHNCGYCGHSCSGGQTCQSGQCKCPTGTVNDNGTCRQPCPTNQIYCNGQCTKILTDHDNCGTCGNDCGDGTCSNGTCACPPNEGYCGTKTCFLFQSDDNNCGSCGTTCMGGSSCTAGKCSCPSGMDFCNGVCVDKSSDVHNCGQCGNDCGSNSQCTSGQCQCLNGFSQCPGNCVDLTSDPNNCGTCGTQVPNGDSCCSGTPQDLQNDPQNCGSCGSQCSQGFDCDGGSCSCNTRDGGCINGDMCIPDGRANGGKYECGEPKCCYCPAPDNTGRTRPQYVKYFDGYGTLRDSTSATHHDTISGIQGGQSRACVAVGLSVGDIQQNFPESIGSFQVYWSFDDNVWHLDQFPSNDSDPNAFNMDNTQVGLVFGYFNNGNPP